MPFNIIQIPDDELFDRIDNDGVIEEAEKEEINIENLENELKKKKDKKLKEKVTNKKKIKKNTRKIEKHKISKPLKKNKLNVKKKKNNDIADLSKSEIEKLKDLLKKIENQEIALIEKEKEIVGLINYNLVGITWDYNIPTDDNKALVYFRKKDIENLLNGQDIDNEKSMKILERIEYIEDMNLDKFIGLKIRKRNLYIKQ